VITSPGRISVRVNDSSKRAAKDSDMYFLRHGQVSGSTIADVFKAGRAGCVVVTPRGSKLNNPATHGG
jgi:hypothetical protein